MARFAIEPGAAGLRVDQAVAAASPGLSVAAARRLIADGGVRIDARLARKGDRVAGGQTVEIDDSQQIGQTTAGQHVTPEPGAPLAVLAVDEDWVAIAKPAGIPSHPLRAGETGTAANALVARFPECADAGDGPREGGLVHRLDTGTSGVLIAARSAQAWSALRRALAEPSCEKIYLAEVRGAAGPGESHEPIGRAGRRSPRVRVGGGRNPLPATTRWEPREPRAETTLLAVHLNRGRAHQVRAHLAAAGHPIVGDPLYGAEADAALHLHAWSVRFRDPRSDRPISVEAPPPDWATMQRQTRS
ncbi:MAG TPA: RluA family pseudouridine synthase [Polyangia bacterium]|nr:RluA family pseudouridine synthase [Polyangia bacterium]